MSDPALQWVFRIAWELKMRPDEVLAFDAIELACWREFFRRMDRRK